MQLVDTFALLGGALVTCSMIPQIIRVLKLKSAREISILFSILLWLGLASWLAYGITLRLIQLIIWNSVGIISVSVLLFAKLKYGR